jgi:4'-phosphopantetheinyl transferase
VWKPPPESLELPADEVHVWRAPLDVAPSRLPGLQGALSDDERQRAARFLLQRHRDRFIVARAALRDVLARYLGVRPEELAFRYARHGKPSLETEAGSHWLRFNLTHSHDLALVALARDRELGVDVEHLHRQVEAERIAERFFSPREAAVLLDLPAGMRHEAFFACWTRKEAYVKAQGGGLTIPLDRFHVSLAPGEPAALLATDDAPEEAARWSMRTLDPGPGYTGALAVEGGDWRLQCWEWRAP